MEGSGFFSGYAEPLGGPVGGRGTCLIRCGGLLRAESELGGAGAPVPAAGVAHPWRHSGGAGAAFLRRRIALPRRILFSVLALADGPRC